MLFKEGKGGNKVTICVGLGRKKFISSESKET